MHYEPRRPPELQSYTTDAFESIVLYDNRAVTATVTQTSDHKYKVTLTYSLVSSSQMAAETRLRWH